jgi:class 3 adenylate cyclase
MLKRDAASPSPLGFEREEALMRCLKCGAENPDRAKFCGECASPFTRRCPSCETENSLIAKFCIDCGKPLENAGGKSQRTAAASSPIQEAAGIADASPEGERKIVTALFADLKGSTELLETIDPEEGRAIVEPLLRIMSDAVRRYEGYLVRTTGDGIFALFGAPVAYEDHPQRALYAALHMQQELRTHTKDRSAKALPALEARVGVHTGEVVAYPGEASGKVEYRLIGHTANLAARMESIAAVGSIAVSETTAKLCEGYFELRNLGPTTVKGVSAPVNVYEVLGPGPLRTHFELSTRRGLTRFVGRERELEQIRRALAEAISGRGQIAAVVAEAGTGKSRLFYEFKAVLPTNCKLLEAYSVSHGKASAWLPVLELLRSYFGIVDTDDTAARREKVRTPVTTLAHELEDTLSYLFGLLGIHDGPDPHAQMDPRIKRQRTLEAIKRILLRDSLNQPLVVIFEDLHWIDEQTQALLDLLADSVASARVLLLLNYRPEYRHEWTNKSYYTQLRLDPLASAEGAAMLAALLGEGVELNPLKSLIAGRTGGNPFFTEEIVQALFDEGALVRNGAVKVTRSLSQLRLPPTVQGMLAARIDRLREERKGLLQTLAVIGRESSLRVLQSVTGIDESLLNQRLAELRSGEFIYEQPVAADTEYVFKHALTQEVAYNSVLIDRRKQLHERIGGALENIYANSLDDHLAELAHHYARANNAANAARYLTLAGKQALERSAFSEAQAQLQQGLEWIKALQESPGRDAQELELASALVPVLVATQGYSAPATIEVAARASALAEKGGDRAEVVLQHFGTWVGTFIAGDYFTGAALADRLLELAQREGSPISLALAHDAQLQTRFFRGDLAGAEEHFIQIGSLLDAPGFAHYAGQFVAVVGLASILAFLMGRPDTARQRGVQAITFGIDSQNSYDAPYGLFFQGWLYVYLRDPWRAEEAAAQGSALAEERGFPYVSGAARIVLGRAQTQLGDPGDGAALIRRGLAGMRQAGSKVAISTSLTWLAEAQALRGKIDDCLGFN